MNIIRHSDDMITDEYVYKNEFRFQRMQKDGKWYVTYKNHIITHGQYRNDIQEWIDTKYTKSIYCKCDNQTPHTDANGKTYCYYCGKDIEVR